MEDRWKKREKGVCGGGGQGECRIWDLEATYTYVITDKIAMVVCDGSEVKDTLEQTMI